MMRVNVEIDDTMPPTRVARIGRILLAMSAAFDDAAPVAIEPEPETVEPETVEPDTAEAKTETRRPRPSTRRQAADPAKLYADAGGKLPDEAAKPVSEPAAEPIAETKAEPAPASNVESIKSPTPPDTPEPAGKSPADKEALIKQLRDIALGKEGGVKWLRGVLAEHSVTGMSMLTVEQLASIIGTADKAEAA